MARSWGKEWCRGETGELACFCMNHLWQYHQLLMPLFAQIGGAINRKGIDSLFPPGTINNE